MHEIENPKEFAEWLRNIAHHIEVSSPLINSVKTGIKPSESGGAIKAIEIEFSAPSY